MDPRNWVWLSKVTNATPPRNMLADDSGLDMHVTAASDTLEAIETQRALDREAEVSADAERLTDYILGTDRALLGIESEVQEAPLREALEEALDGAPYERVLLTLCHSRDIDDIMDTTEATQDQPLEPNAEGFSEITAALTALCANVARSRRILDATETIGERGIETMVRDHWKGPPYRPSSEVIPEMIEQFGRMFVSADDKTLRGFLDLPARMAEPPVDIRPANRVVAEQSGDVSADALRAAAALWTTAWAQAQRELGMLRKSVDTWVQRLESPGVEIEGGSWARVMAIFDAISDRTLDTDIMAMDGQSGEAKTRSIAEVRTRIGDKLEHLGSDANLSLLDSFQSLNGERTFRSLFEGALVAMRDLMVPPGG